MGSSGHFNSANGGLGLTGLTSSLNQLSPDPGQSLSYSQVPAGLRRGEVSRADEHAEQ